MIMDLVESRAKLDADTKVVVTLMRGRASRRESSPSVHPLRWHTSRCMFTIATFHCM